MLAVLVGQSLGLLVVFDELHRSLAALGQQRPVGQERLLLPNGHVEAIGEAALLQRQRKRQAELTVLPQRIPTPPSEQPKLHLRESLVVRLATGS